VGLGALLALADRFRGRGVRAPADGSVGHGYVAGTVHPPRAALDQVGEDDLGGPLRAPREIAHLGGGQLAADPPPGYPQNGGGQHARDSQRRSHARQVKAEELRTGNAPGLPHRPS
jgi:hypothetical protein